MKNLKKNDIIKCRVRIYTNKCNLTKRKEDCGIKFLLCEVNYYGIALDNRTIRLVEGTQLTAYKKSGFGKTHTQDVWNRPIDNQWALIDRFEIVERA